jgi:hypothetical protein
LAFLDLFVSETAQGAPKSDMKDLWQGSALHVSSTWDSEFNAVSFLN